MSKDKEERKLRKVKVNLMRRPEFALWSGVMMVGTTSLSDDIPTACTDGRNEIYGRQLVRDLNEKELGFVILHETLHKAFRHLTTWRKLYKENAQLANQACDFVINLMLVDMDKTEQFIAFPKKDGERFGLYDEKYRNMNAKQVFDLLKQEQKQDGGGSRAGGDPGEGAGGFDEHDWGGAGELSQEEQRELERDIDQAIRQGQIAAQKAIGKNGGDLNRALGDLLAPKIDWREVLREFVTTTCSAKDASSWRRVNRRFIGSDIYLPTLIGERVGRIAVGVDTSGSISGGEITRFLSEVKSITDNVRPETLDLIYWDAQVAGHEVYGDFGHDMDSLVTSTKPKGGGGTDPRAMMKYLKDEKIEPECIIMLTDGEIYDWGNDWNAPVLWVVCNPYRGKSITAPVGKTVHIEE